MNRVRRAFASLARDAVFMVLAAACVLLSLLSPAPFATYPGLVDWPTVFALGGLLVLTRGIEVSGALTVAAQRLVRRVRSQRALALVLVGASASLSTFLTNDVALFILVPLTLTLRAIDGMPVTRLIVFEAIAVNVGSALTPFGNPQNLFLWGRSGVSVTAFVAALAPVVLIASIALLALTALSFPNRAVEAPHAETPPIDRRLFVLALVLYLPFIVATDLHHAGPALLVVLVVFVVFARRALVGVDWALLGVFVLMFIDLRLLAAFGPVRAAIGAVDLDVPLQLYALSVLSSQVISNVPAAILMSEYSHDWTTIAIGVTVGGFGLFIGSLANLIALRLAQDRRAWLLFHAYSLPFLLVVAGATAGWIALR